MKLNEYTWLHLHNKKQQLTHWQLWSSSKRLLSDHSYPDWVKVDQNIIELSQQKETWCHALTARYCICITLVKHAHATVFNDHSKINRSKQSTKIPKKWLKEYRIKADWPLTRDTFNAPWLLTNRQFQWTGNGHSQLPLAELGKPSPNIDLLCTTGSNGRT